MIISPDQSKRYRLALNWTVERLADLTGLSRSTLYGWEAGKRLIRQSNLRMIRATFDGAMEALRT